MIKTTLVLALALVLAMASPVMAQTVIFEEHFDTVESMNNWVDESKLGTQYYWQDGKVFQDKTWTQRFGYGYLTYFGPDGQGLDIPDSFVATWKIYDYGQMDIPAYMAWMKWNATGIGVYSTVPFTGALAGLRLLYNEDGFIQVWKNGVRLVEYDGLNDGYRPPIPFESTVRLEVLELPTNPVQWIVSCYFNDELVFEQSAPLLNELVGRVGTFGFIIMGGLYAIDDIVITTHPDYEPPPPSLDERVEELEYEVQTLSEQYQSLQEQVTSLQEALNALSDHSHDYLTGKGTGHNNSLATTGPPTQGAPAPVPAGK